MSEKDDSFHVAINMNNAKELEDVLDSASDDFDINQVIPTRHTALHLTVEFDNITMVKLLLEKGADATLKTAHGDTCLHVAARKGNVIMVELLSEYVDINVVNSEGCTPLHEAVRCDRFEIVKLLLEKGALTDSRRSDQESGGNTLLHDAVQMNNVAMIELLLKHEANPNIQNQLGESAFYSSLSHLLKFDDILSVVDLFLKHGAHVDLKNNFSENALHLATYSCPPEVVKRLLQLNMNINERSLGGLTPLHAAILTYDQETLMEKVQLIVESGADINAVDEKGDAPLNTAVLMQLREVVSYLLAKGAEVNHHRKEHLAVITALENSDLITVDMLLHAGAVIDFSDNYILERCYKMDSIIGLKYLLKNGAVADLNTELGHQIFTFTIRSAELEMVQNFLENRANVNSYYQISDSEDPLQPLEYAYSLYQENHAGAKKVIALMIKHISTIQFNGSHVDKSVLNRIKSEQWMLDIYNECNENIVEAKTLEIHLESELKNNN